MGKLDVAADLPRLLSAEELADYLGVSRQTVYNWRLDGRGPKSINIGKRLLYRAQEINDWLDSKAAS